MRNDAVLRRALPLGRGLGRLGVGPQTESLKSFRQARTEIALT